MPPRGRGAQSEEAKKAAYDYWMASEEHSLCQKLYNTRKNEPHELKELHPGSDDILDDWQPVLANLFKLVETLKVPGRKSKCKSTAPSKTHFFQLTLTPLFIRL